MHQEHGNKVCQCEIKDKNKNRFHSRLSANQMPIIPVFTGGAALPSGRINMFIVLSVTHLKVAACAVVPQVNPSRADRWSVHGRKCSANSNHHDFGST